MKAHIKDKSYWNAYYQEHHNDIKINTPSSFSRFCLEKLQSMFKHKVNMLEIGCGNGRDAEHFAHWHNVKACDHSELSIQELKNKNSSVSYFCADFTELDSSHGSYDAIYSRFTLHSIDLASESKVIANVYDMLTENGVFMIEARSNYDEICGKGERISDYEWIYDGHYRRFIVLEDFIVRVKQAGFHPVFIQQSDGLAKFGDRDPVVIRAILKK